MVSNTSPRSALRPLLAATTASADFSLRVPTSPFQASGEISPGKNALLHCTTAGFTPLRLDHESFAESCPLALLGNAFYPVLVHRLAASLHASSPHSVTLMQLRFASFAVINLRWDLHPQECARAGRTRKPRLSSGVFASAEAIRTSCAARDPFREDPVPGETGTPVPGCSQTPGCVDHSIPCPGSCAGRCRPPGPGR